MAVVTASACCGSFMVATPVKISAKRVRQHPNSSKPTVYRCSLAFTIAFHLLVAQWNVAPVASQYDKDLGMTKHEDLQRTLHIDLHDNNSPENVNLDLATADARDAARQVLQRIGSSVQDRLTAMFAKTKTPECRALIGEHFGYYLNAIGKEESLPFAQAKFQNECPEPVLDFDNLPNGTHLGIVQNRTYQPPRNETEYIDHPDDLKLCYGILTHDDAEATIRLIQVLYEDGHVFVIHVDGKETSDETYHTLVEYAVSRVHVHVVANHQRVRVNWGGFSMVNATLQMLQYAFAIDEDPGGRSPLDFHKFVHLAASSYPLASNHEIRQQLASFPLDANFLHVIMKPTRPGPQVWHYFVECDDALHRIYRLPPLQNATAGVELYTSSQWFIISREFAYYIAVAEPGTFVHDYLEYAQHVVVADETFFGTVVRNTHFCTKHHNRNFLHLQFDRWESDLPAKHRDERKCMMVDPDHCGRSPTTMTVDYADILELSDDLFARKFVKDNDVKNIVDSWRDKRTERLRASNLTEANATYSGVDMSLEGHGVLIVAKETVNDDVPLCLGLGESGNKLQLVPCFEDWVKQTLADQWETGGVVLDEVLPSNRWDIGPCTSDGHLKRLPSAEMQVTPGNYSVTGPRCMLKQVDGLRAGRCFDSDSESTQPGGETQVYPCTHRWYQFLSFGDGRHAPKGSMYTTIPSHIVRQIKNLGHEQNRYMCLGVYGMGTHDEEDWDDIDEPKDEATVHTTVGTNGESVIEEESEAEESLELADWVYEQIVTTQCSNTGAIVEWLFIPFIEDDIDDDDVLGEKSDDKKHALLKEETECLKLPDGECSSAPDFPVVAH